MVNGSRHQPAEASPAGDGSFRFDDGFAGRVLVCTALESHAAHVFTTRQLQLRSDTITDDYRRIGAALGVTEDRVVRVRQVHGNAVIAVTGGTILTSVNDADAVVSTDPDCAISVRVADCLPILIADRDSGVVAAIHAGWRGAAAGVIGAAVQAMTDAGAPPASLMAAVGPAIGPCCYQVDDPVRSEFEEQMPGSAEWFSPDGVRWKLDLWAAARDQLTSAGLHPGAIHVSRLCTAHDAGHWFSFRREGAGSGRMVAAIRPRPRSRGRPQPAR